MNDIWHKGFTDSEIVILRMTSFIIPVIDENTYNSSFFLIGNQDEIAGVKSKMFIHIIVSKSLKSNVSFLDSPLLAINQPLK